MRAANPIDVAIRTSPSAWFTPDRRIYRADMVLSAALGWSTLAAAIVVTGWTRVVLLIVAAFAFYRAVLFIHEITHLRPHDVPIFRTAWNALIGLRYHARHHWIPSLLYHSLGRAHRLVAETLAADSPYAATSEPDMATAVASLVRRASRTHG